MHLLTAKLLTSSNSYFTSESCSNYFGRFTFCIKINLHSHSDYFQTSPALIKATLTADMNTFYHEPNQKDLNAGGKTVLLVFAFIRQLVPIAIATLGYVEVKYYQCFGRYQ